MTPEIAVRLAASEITLAARLASSEFTGGAQAREYCMFTRGNCVALVQMAGERFVSMGSTGTMAEGGLSYLVWSEGKAWLAAHGSRVEAAAEQVEAIRSFSRDLQAALGLNREIEPRGDTEAEG